MKMINFKIYTIIPSYQRHQLMKAAFCQDKNVKNRQLYSIGRQQRISALDFFNVNHSGLNLSASTFSNKIYQIPLPIAFKLSQFQNIKTIHHFKDTTIYSKLFPSQHQLYKHQNASVLRFQI